MNAFPRGMTVASAGAAYVPAGERSFGHSTDVNMLKTNVLTALTKQIQYEQNNAHAYKAVALFFGRRSLHGLEAFMKKQAREERMHAGKLIRHVVDRGSEVELGAIAAPRINFESPLEAVKMVRDLERSTTDMIHRLYELARKENDYALEIL